MGREEAAGPIATATGLLLGWLSSAGVPARLAPPGDEASSADLCVWPVALLPEQATCQGTGRSPLRLRVRYLITAGRAGGVPAELLDHLLVASASAGLVQLAFEPVTAEFWRGFGLAPRLGLYADVPVRVAPPVPAVPRVRAPLRLDEAAVGRVHGTVVGPGGVPVPGIRVVLAQTGAATYTGSRGQFSFPVSPAGRPVRLQLSGRGVDLVAEVARQDDEPVVIHCDIEGV